MNSRPEESSKFALLAEAYEEFCHKRENDPQLTVTAFAAQFPSIQSSLANFLAAHEVLALDSDLVRKAVAADWPEAGDRFGNYHLIEMIGRGGFSRVYLARDSRVGDREVVLKVTADAVREAHALGRLQHPHVVPIHNVADDPESGLTGICMPYLGCATLLDIVDEVRADCRRTYSAKLIDDVIARSNSAHPVGDAQRMNLASTRIYSDFVDAMVLILSRVADALAAAHRLGIFHGDIKPSNIVITTGRVPLLLDFNLAQDATAKCEIVGGTITYMAPEQLDLGRIPVVNGGTDVFALATMSYELLTGICPFPIADAPALTGRAAVDAVRQAHAHGLTPFSKALIRSHPDVCSALREALSVDPAERPSAAELSLILKRSLEWPQITRRWLINHPRISIAVFLIVLWLAIAGITFAVTREPYLNQQLRLALKSIENDEFTQAATHFTNLVRTQPLEPKYLLWRGITRAHANELDLALQDFAHYEEQSMEGKGDGRGIAAAGYWIYLVRLFNEKREPMFLIHRLPEARTKGLNTPELLHDLGVAYWRNGKWKQAVDHFHQALEADPTIVESHIAMFCCELDRVGNLAKANPEDISRLVQLGETVMSKNVPYAAIHLQLATFFASVPPKYGDYHELALECYRTAIQNGAHPDAIRKAVAFDLDLHIQLEEQGILDLPSLRNEQIVFEPVLDPLKREWEQLLQSVGKSRLNFQIPTEVHAAFP